MSLLGGVHVSDIIIGAPYRSQVNDSDGKAYLIFGKATGWPKYLNLTDADASFIGGYASDGAGSSVAGAGDINNDGFDDILIGAPYAHYFDTYGKCYIFYGKASGWKRNVSVNSADFILNGKGFFGFWVAAAGDVNHDGYGDIIVPQEYGDGPYPTPWIRVYFGSASGINENADLIFSAGYDTAQIATGVGDINGDGIDDMMFAVPYPRDTDNHYGIVYLLFGRTSGWPSYDFDLYNVGDASYIGQTDDTLGIAATGVGDVNGDGINDLVIGGRETIRNYTGMTYLLLGKKSDWTKYVNIEYHNNASFYGEGPHDLAGIALAGGDFNGDGYGEILIGAPYNPEGGYKDYGPMVGRITAGKVYLVQPRTVQGPITVKMAPEKDKTAIAVDQLYSVTYTVTGASSARWIFETNATWLWWDPINDRIEGTPTVADLGSYWLDLRVTDGSGHWDRHNFTLKVMNELPPNHPPSNVEILTLHNDTKKEQLANGMVELSASATDVDALQDLNYTWMENGLPIAWGNHTYAKIPKGHHIITLSVSDGISMVNISVTVDIIGPTPNHPGKVSPNNILIISSVILLLSVIAILVFVTTEVGKYSSIVFMAPLYSRIRKEALLDNFTRGKIYQYLVEHPGSYLSLIIKELELNTSVAVFHLNKLEQKGYLRSTKDGLRRRFYPDGKNIPMRPSKLERITRAIRLNPGITQKELAEDLGLKFSTINEYVIKMKGTGLLTVIQNGKKKHLYLFDEQSSEKNGYRDLDNQ